MRTITIDTQQLVEQLRTAGIPQEQADAVARVLAKAQDNRATSDYLDAELESSFAPLRTDLLVLKWMMGLMIAGVMSLVLKNFF